MEAHRIAYIVVRFLLKPNEQVQTHIAIIVKGYPRLSETFIAQEIHALEKRGLSICIVSLRRPTDHTTHSIHSAIQSPVLYLPEYLYQEPGRVLRAWWRARRMRGYVAARNAWCRDLLKDRTFNRIRRFGQALVLATELPDGCTHLYAHFMHTPGSVARYTSVITATPWSCSAHAKDIWTTPDWEKKQKLEDCTWLVSCTAANVEHLKAFTPDPDKVTLAYHGLDFDRFDEPPGRNSKVASGPLCILSIGRAVEKKGYDDLLQALAYLPADIDWRFVHVGGGPLIDKLKQKASSLDIAAKVEWRGAQSHQHVLHAYRDADVFVLPCRIADDGDRDGLPNVLLEAQSQKLPCVSTSISGIPELVKDRETGLLVQPNDPVGLAGAIQELLTQPELREQLGQAGFKRVRQCFSATDGIDRIINRLPASGMSR